MKHIVKRKGHREYFDERKVYASCYAACLAAHIDHLKAEGMCEKVAKCVKTWIAKKPKVASQDIFKQVTSILKKIDKNAAYMYETHRDIS